MNDDARRQFRAGLALIQKSGLARWDTTTCQFAPSDAAEFERTASAHDCEHGRVMLWIVFAAGTEYLLKAACLKRGFLKAHKKSVLRPPAQNEDLAGWVRRVLQDPSTVRESVTDLGTLKGVRFDQLVAGHSNEKLARAGFALFQQSIRNRDSHHYVSNVRAGHFHVVEKLFVPAVNAALESMNLNETEWNDWTGRS